MIVREHVTVISADGERARVQVVKPDDPSKCKTCPSSGGCGGASGGRMPAMDVIGLGETAPGDAHVIDVEMANPAYAAFLLFIVPMAAAFAAGLVAFQLTQNGLVGLAGGIVGAAAAYGLVHVLGPTGPARATIVKPQ